MMIPRISLSHSRHLDSRVQLLFCWVQRLHLFLGLFLYPLTLLLYHGTWRFSKQNISAWGMLGISAKKSLKRKVTQVTSITFLCQTNQNRSTGKKKLYPSTDFNDSFDGLVGYEFDTPPKNSPRPWVPAKKRVVGRQRSDYVRGVWEEVPWTDEISGCESRASVCRHQQLLFQKYTILSIRGWLVVLWLVLLLLCFKDAFTLRILYVDLFIFILCWRLCSSLASLVGGLLHVFLCLWEKSLHFD